MDLSDVDSITWHLGHSRYRTPNIKSSRLKFKNAPNVTAIPEVKMLAWTCGGSTTSGTTNTVGTTGISLIVGSFSARVKPIESLKYAEA